MPQLLREDKKKQKKAVTAGVRPTVLRRTSLRNTIQHEPVRTVHLGDSTACCRGGILGDISAEQPQSAVTRVERTVYVAEEENKPT